MFDKIKYYYEVGLWSKKRVWNVVGKVLTAEEYKEITNEEYEIQAVLNPEENHEEV